MKKLKKHLIPALIILTTLLWVDSGYSSDLPLSKRKTVINFEEEVIEGINRRPLDNINQISESESRRNLHLYRRRGGFSDLNEEMAQDLGLNK
jgi:hypothetical protein